MIAISQDLLTAIAAIAVSTAFEKFSFDITSLASKMRDPGDPQPGALGARNARTAQSRRELEQHVVP
jgi:hypothetical protein